MSRVSGTPHALLCQRSVPDPALAIEPHERAAGPARHPVPRADVSRGGCPVCRHQCADRLQGGRVPSARRMARRGRGAGAWARPAGAQTAAAQQLRAGARPGDRRRSVPCCLRRPGRRALRRGPPLSHACHLRGAFGQGRGARTSAHRPDRRPVGWHGDQHARPDRLSAAERHPLAQCAYHERARACRRPVRPARHRRGPGTGGARALPRGAVLRLCPRPGQLRDAGRDYRCRTGRNERRPTPDRQPRPGGRGGAHNGGRRRPAVRMRQPGMPGNRRVRRGGRGGALAPAGAARNRAGDRREPCKPFRGPRAPSWRHGPGRRRRAPRCGCRPGSGRAGRRRRDERDGFHGRVRRDRRGRGHQSLQSFHAVRPQQDPPGRRASLRPRGRCGRPARARALLCGLQDRAGTRQQAAGSGRGNHRAPAERPGPGADARQPLPRRRSAFDKRRECAGRAECSGGAMSGGALMAGITAWIAGMRRLLVKAYCPERRLSRSGGADRARGSEDLRRTSASEHAGSACRRRAIPMMWRALLPVAFALAGPSARPALAQQKSVTQPAGPARTDGYSVLSRRCLSCHSGAKPAGGLDLARRAGLVKGGASGPALAASSEQSLLLKAVRYAGPQMPPSGRLAQSEIDTMARWIKEGAAYPAGANPAEPTGHLVPPAVTPETMRFWSFQPVRRSKTPAVKDRAWARNPIDAFVLSRLEAGHLAPNGPASRAALIRRASYDLTGLPPTPEAVQAFVADRSPDAYEKVIDRLLASPQYGEKWGRHWLDLVHFAETNSYERDGVKPNAWRYRDYVIDSLNADKPYDQFIREQLAGDELPGRTPEMLIATGYYRLGIWDDEPVDREQAYYDDVDDIVRTTAETFLGLTAGCARCHDHKIDPIPQKDYYSFVSFFAGVNRYGPQCQRPIAPAAEVRKGQGEVAAHGALVQANAAEIAAIESKVAAAFSR